MIAAVEIVLIAKRIKSPYLAASDFPNSVPDSDVPHAVLSLELYIRHFMATPILWVVSEPARICTRYHRSLDSGMELGLSSLNVGESGPGSVILIAIAVVSVWLHPPSHNCA